MRPSLGLLLLGLPLGDLLLRPRPAPRRRLGQLLVERDGTGAEARNTDQISRSDPEPDSESQEHRGTHVAASAFSLAEKPLGTSTRCGPFEREARQVSSGPHVFSDKPKKSLGVHPRELATFAKLALAHSSVGVFVDEQTAWRCTWTRMGGLCS